MQPFGQFQVVTHSTRRTRLRAPEACRTAAQLAPVCRRLAACDGIEQVAINPATGGVLVRHSPGFSWDSIGPAAWRLDGVAPVSAPAARPAPAAQLGRTGPARLRAPGTPLGTVLAELLSLALEGAIGAATRRRSSRRSR